MARRYAAKVDANQQDIVNALRKAGASVQFLHGVGGGCPDILVGFRGQNLLMEIKDGAKSPSRQKLTEWQEKWGVSWNGQACVVSSEEEALAVLQSPDDDQWQSIGDIAKGMVKGAVS